MEILASDSAERISQGILTPEDQADDEADAQSAENRLGGIAQTYFSGSS